MMRAHVILFCLAIAASLDAAMAQNTAETRAPTVQPVLVLSQERLFTESQKGQSLLEAEGARRQAHRREGEELDRVLEEEERRLTTMRSVLAAAEFDQLADAFDDKVNKVRNEHQQKSEQLGIEIEKSRQEFLQELVPIVAQIMQQRGASLVFERRQVLFTGPNVDITPEVIAIMDKAAGFD